MRIAKYLAHCGVASRRKAESLASAGLITVNGEIVKDLGYQIDEKDDRVVYREKVIKPERLYYYAINKPPGFTSSCRDKHARKLVTDLVPGNRQFLRPVGRLDLSSRGLMILTNDTELINRLIHPKYGIEKEYLVKVDRNLNTEEEIFLQDGFEDKDGRLKIDFLQKQDNNAYKAVIAHGRKREIRRLFKRLQVNVLDLKRTKLGSLSLGNLAEGKSRPLTDREVRELKENA